MSYNNAQGTTYLVSQNPSELFKQFISSQKFFVIKLLTTIAAGCGLLGLIIVNAATHGQLGIVANIIAILFVLSPLVLECAGFWVLQKDSAGEGRMEKTSGLLLVKIVAYYKLICAGIISLICLIGFFISLFASEQISNWESQLNPGLVDGLGDFGIEIPHVGAASVFATLFTFTVIFACCFFMIWYYLKKIKMLNALISMILGERLREHETYMLSEYVAYVMFLGSIWTLIGAALLFAILPLCAYAGAMILFYLFITMAQNGCAGTSGLMISTGIIKYNKQLCVMNAQSNIDSEEIQRLQQDVQQQKQQNIQLEHEILRLQNELQKKSNPNPNTKHGTIKGMGGTMNGAIIDISSGKEYIIGRDPSVCSVVISSSYAKVSKKHCGIIYDRQKNVYKVVDYSTNGTFRGDGKRLVEGKYNIMNPGTSIVLANTDNIFIFN